MTTRRDLPARRIGSKQVRRQPVRRASPRLRSVQIYGLAFMVLSLIGTVAVCISPAFAAHRLEIYGARFTGEQYIRDLVDLSAGPNLFALQSDRIANQLVLLPAVESVKVEVVLPDTIVVTLHERKPSLIWVIGDSRYVVDDTGLLFGVVDSVGNPVMDAASPSPGGSPDPGATDSGQPDPGATDPGATAGNTAGGPAVDSPSASIDAAIPARLLAAKATPKPTPKPTAKPKVTPKPTPKPTPTPVPTPAGSPTIAPPSLLPVPTADPAESAGPQAVSLPVVFDRRVSDAGLHVGSIVDPIALDAGYRLGSITPADLGSAVPGLVVVLDDANGFTLNSGPGGWVAQFGFYTETLRKDTVIPTQVRDLRSMLLHYGENHVAWVFLVADIADNRIDTFIPK